MSAERRNEEQGYYDGRPGRGRVRGETIEWRPTCAPCGGTLLLGPNPHPCRECGKTTDRALRVVS